MATGVYGNVRGADVLPEDMQIFYRFTPNRGETPGPLVPLDPNTVISRTANPNSGGGFEFMDGLYTLTLPANDFTEKGIYTIIIKPIEIRLDIKDCGVLSNMSDVRGVVFDPNTVPQFSDKFNNGNLVGYRINYLSGDGTRIPNLFRVITSNNFAEAITSGNNDETITQKYTLKSTPNLVFCTVTPGSASEVKPNVLPYIGNPGDSVILTNTYFNPIMLEIEMVEHDIETLAYGIFGNQSKSVEDGIYTVYNFQNNIYAQWDMYEIKDQMVGKPLFEIRERRTNIDFTKQFNNVISTE